MAMPTTIKIRRNGDGYAASAAGQRATCSWSRQEAARRVAAKLYGEDSFELHKIETSERDADKGVVCCYDAYSRA